VEGGSKEEKRNKMAKMMGDFDQRAKDMKMQEMELRKTRTSNTKLQNELMERETIIDSQRERIIELGEQMRANEERMATMSLAMKSSELQVRHSDNRAIRTSQQIAGDAEMATRKAVRRAEELEKTVQRFEADNKVAQARINEKNDAVDRLHVKLKELQNVANGHKAEADQLRSILNATEAQGNEMSDNIYALRQEQNVAVAKKNELIRNLRQLRLEDKERIEGYQRELGESIFARVEEQAVTQTSTPTPRPASASTTRATTPTAPGQPKKGKGGGRKTKTQSVPQAAKLTYRRIMQVRDALMPRVPGCLTLVSCLFLT